MHVLVYDGANREESKGAVNGYSSLFDAYTMER
jgi:hypothetical protein